jgi:hypothetical protein
MKQFISHALNVMLLLGLTIFAATPANAHCDTMNGPVVAAARQALAMADVTPVLKWVKPEYEVEVRESFQRARKVRARGADAAELADRYFFETLVRLHRMGEGEPFTGLKDKEETDPMIAGADAALERGDLSELLSQHIANGVADGIRTRFARVQQTKLHADDSVAAGREYVAAYVDFIHYVHSMSADKDAEHQHSSHEEPSTIVARPEILQFTATRTRLRKNEEAKLALAFAATPSRATFQWRLNCRGVAIKGWSSDQILSITERHEGGDIATIEGRDFAGTNAAVMITVKRSKRLTPMEEGSCTAEVLTEGAQADQRMISFVLH